MPFPSDSKPRPLPYRLRVGGAVSGATDNVGVHEAQLEWPTSDPNQIVSVTIDLSLNEYVGLASAIDVGRDIAYDDDSIDIWWLWTRKLTFPPPITPARYRYRSAPFDWGKTDDGGYFVNIHEDCAVPIYVNFYEGCCGDGDASGASVGFSGNGGAGSGGAGINVGDIPNKCDVVSYLVPYFVTQAREWLIAVDASVDAGSDLIDAIVGTSTEMIDFTGVSSSIVEDVADVIAGFLDPLIVNLEDIDLIRRVQTNYWGRVPSDRQFTSFSRSDAIAIGQSFPFAWGNIGNATLSSPRVLGELFGRVADTQKLTTELAVAIGKQDTALCSAIASTYGQNYETPPPITPPETVPVSSTLIGTTLYRVYKLVDNVTLNADIIPFALPTVTQFPACGAYSTFVKTEEFSLPGGGAVLTVDRKDETGTAYVIGGPFNQSEGNVGVAKEVFSRPLGITSDVQLALEDAGVTVAPDETLDTAIVQTVTGELAIGRTTTAAQGGVWTNVIYLVTQELNST